jgi:hypothetical protein
VRPSASAVAAAAVGNERKRMRALLEETSKSCHGRAFG